MELFDFADSRLGTRVECEHPSIAGYEAGGLVDKQRRDVGTCLSPLAARGGFLAESFVKPPAEVVFRLPFPVSLGAVVVSPRARMQVAARVSLFVLRSRGERWDYVGRIEWADDGSACAGAVHNQELSAPAVARLAAAGGSLCEATPGAWAPMERTPDSLHMTAAVKVRIASMHRAGALGVGAVELWAQPSQRLPRAARDDAWARVRRAVATHAIGRPRAEPPRADQPASADCPAEFVDPITHNIMRDPVILPTGARCDRSTIDRHLLAHTTDPFTGLPLAASDIRPDLALQLQVRAWLEQQQAAPYI
ncbi:RING finger protein 37 [Coemansia javaensis]|uniref:RING-type E3 ubiquitin transferase n=1 Tax=Coemansia javaensis TaxID=2761396 RepID=A0A9W8LHX9_9FUNG|nr:RING finger protein 37 [Coemansia javaensis]